MLTSKNKCIGCGVDLQTEDPLGVGYVKKIDQVFCMNCFKLMHYGEANSHFHPDSLPSFKKNALIVVVASILYLDTLASSPIKRLGEDYKVLYIINQIDLLPDATSKNFLLGKVQKTFRESRIPYEDIILMSAKNPYDIDHLKDYLKDSKYKEVYLIGLQNSGKTTLFKALTGNKDALAMPKAALTQSILSDTFEGISIYDTPGLYQGGYLHEFFEYKDYKDLLPNTQFHPRNGVLKTGEAIAIGGLVGVVVLKGETKSTLYTSNYIKHHLTNDQKILSILTDNKVFDLKFDTYGFKDYALKEAIKYQFTLADFGILHLLGPVTVRIYSHPKLHITLSEGFFK